MYRSLFLFILFWVSYDSSAQRFKTIEIVKKADSLLIALVGQNVFDNHYQLDSNSEMDPVVLIGDKERKIKQISLTSSRSGNFKFIAVNYIFYIKRNQQPQVKTRIILDKNLHSIRSIDISFIPEFILHNTHTHFLSEQEALEIAKTKFKKQGIEIKSRIYYDPSKKDYTWEVVNILEEMESGSRRVDIIELTPIQGEVIRFEEDVLQGFLR